MRVVTGPFHPDLELALVHEVRQLKDEAPLSSLAIIVPSSALSHYLRRLLVIEAALPLLNVYFLTFHQLALRLYEEGRRRTATADPPLLPVDDAFFEQLLRSVVQRNLPGLERFRQFGRSAGAWTALWATLQDLNDAMVEPEVALRALAEGVFGAEDAPALRALFYLYAAMREASRALSVGTPEDIASAAVEHVPGSPFLARLERLYYYGFYDLTQVQLSLFEAIVASASVTLFFPLCEHPAFGFARRFFERYISPRMGRLESKATPHAHSPETVLFSTVGPEDELATVCKQILLLVETHGYRFEEIGVVARTLGPYRTALRRLFDRHRIPFSATATPPLIQEPAVKALLQLASLPLTGLYRASVMDLLTSPFYRVDRLGREVEPRPDLWKLAVRKLRITRGEEEWQRLAAVAQSGLILDAGAEVEDEEGEPDWSLTIGEAQLRLLWRLVAALLEDIRALPPSGTFGVLTAAFLRVAQAHLALPGLGDSAGQSEPEHPLHSVGEGIRAVFEGLEQFDRIGEEVGWEEWGQVFTRLVEDAAIPSPDQNHPGVQVMDAMAARGLGFRALFLLGLNEKVFPRFIREDAFLRDRHRRALDATLGYKIDEKLAGYDEERLLFTLLTQAARDRLYLLYQRADAESRPLVPSGYLSDKELVLPACRVGGEHRVPRRFSDRIGTAPFLSELLDHEEYARWEVLRGSDPSRLLEATCRGAGLFESGTAAMQAMEEESGGPGPYDGITGLLTRHWQELSARGLSPTSLERYARCPFQYFAAQVLRLEVPPLPLDDVQAQTIGQLCHEVLEVCYRQLGETGWPARQLPAASLQQYMEAAAEQVFTAYARQHGTGHALTWQLAREAVTTLVRSVAEADQDDYLATGYQPIAFELEAQGRLEVPTLKELPAITVRGRLDRLDRRMQPPGLRVIDYKYRQARSLKMEDRDLTVGAIRSIHLQPPLYALMQVEEASQGSQPTPLERVEFLFLAPHSDPPVERAVFESATWHAPAGRHLQRTMTTLLQGIHSGQFHILPGRYCNHCEFSAACRRLHGPTWWRAHRSPAAQRLRQLRKLTASGDINE